MESIRKMTGEGNERGYKERIKESKKGENEKKGVMRQTHKKSKLNTFHNDVIYWKMRMRHIIYQFDVFDDSLHQLISENI